MRGFVIAAVGVALASAAAAQSRRYPARQVDKDAEDAGKSKMWDAAVSPKLGPYKTLIELAKVALAQRTIDQTTIAIEKLGEAIQLLPHEGDAYLMRGFAYHDRQDWAKCAADLAAADQYVERDDQSPAVLAELRRRRGVCLARTGKLAEAERVLADAVTTTAPAGTALGETWMRLGEVRIALGKLDEAIAALRVALDGGEPAPPALTHFLLATAYDRARQPADAQQEVSEATRIDRALSALYHPTVPPIGPGDADYMLGLAFTAEPARPEWSLAYFRRFLVAAPNSPWRKRAEDHVREVKSDGLPASITKSGSAAVEQEAVRVAAHRAMPQLRACLAKRPTTVVEVIVTKAGQATPASDRSRPRFLMAAEGVKVERGVGELEEAELDAIQACIAPIASRLALPLVKERDTFYRASFYVVGP